MVRRMARRDAFIEHLQQSPLFAACSRKDLQLVAKTAKMALTLKYADYAADKLYTDTTKLWLSVDYAF